VVRKETTNPDKTHSEFHHGSLSRIIPLHGHPVVHHLAHLAPQPRNLILLPGFQVAGTRGRALLDGAAALKMFAGFKLSSAQRRCRDQTVQRLVTGLDHWAW
jgi:Cft2 family RNA processing exonuclease